MKKFLSLLVVLALVIGLMPAALATDDVIDTAEELQAAIDSAAVGDTITLGSDITVSEIITINKAITLDGNGKTLTSTAGRAINIDCAGEVTVKNLTVNASGERAFNVIQKAVNKLSLENVTATAANYTLNIAASAGAAKVEIKDSTLTGLCTVNVSAAGAEVTVEDSAINCNDNNTTEGESYAALCLNKEAVGGKIIAVGCTITVAEGSDSVKGRNGAEDGVVTIDGSSDDVITIVAVITYEGSPYYHAFTTLQSAIDFAKNGDCITLIRDVSESSIITINKAITLDGNGKTLTSTAGRAINIDCAGEVTVKNLTVNASGERAFNVIQKAVNKLSLENVTATAANYTLNIAASAGAAKVEIKDSTLTGLCTVNVSAAGAEVTVEDSAINCNDNNTTEGESYAALCLNKEAVGGKIIAVGCTITVAEGSDSVKGRNGAEDGVVTIDGSSDDVITIVAVITYEGSPYYHAFTTLQSAIDFAKNGDCIVLIADNSETVTVSRSVILTLDENGKNFAGEIKAGENTTMSYADGVYTFVYTEPSNPPAPPAPSNPPSPSNPPASTDPVEPEEGEEEEDGGRIFEDIGEDHTFVNEIEWAYEEGYVKGIGEDTYNPSASISRQQLWMVLSRHAEEDAENMVDAKDWAVEQGLSDGTDPGAAISRQQMVTMLYRYAQLMGYDTSVKADLAAYPDAANVADYAVDAMAWAVANGIINGTTVGTLNPAGNTTRGAFAAILYRFCEKVA